MTEEAATSAVAVAELLQAEAQRQLDNQEAALGAVRTTMGAVLTGASIVVSVFGAVLTAEQHRSGFSIAAEVAALALFAATVWASVVILRPRDWHGEHELNGWLDRVNSGHAPSVLTIATNFAEYLNSFRRQNGPILRDLQRWLTFACVLLGLQVLAWALAVV